jgi:deferrochelatase/peroxidase EfeB
MTVSDGPITGVGPALKDIWLDQFTFKNDPDGATCPYGAHIRRANPRNADLPEGTRGWIGKFLRTLGFNRKHTHDDLLSSTRFHRILRRGRSYNDPAPGAPEQGLRFIALNANISRQFEFVQTSWFVNSKFNGLDEDDPLVGARTPLMTGARIDRFTRPQDTGLKCRLNDVPRFVTVRGGAYFFMPGLSALRYIASG